MEELGVITWDHPKTPIERLEKWGINVAADCVLCGSRTKETFQHLFFECIYSENTWSTLLKWMNIHRQVHTWIEEIKWLTTSIHISNTRSHVLICVFATIVYQLWIEMNGCRFKVQCKKKTQLVKGICLQVHIKGQQQHRWQDILASLNYYPVYVI